MGEHNGRVYLSRWLDSSEMQLLLFGCQRFLGTASRHDLSQALAKPFDERAFFELSQHHRLTLILYKFVVNPYSHYFSKTVCNAFEHATRQYTLSHLRFSKIALTLSKALFQARVPHIFLKGPLLNHRLSPNLLFRYSGDLDVFVKKQELRKADGCLKQLGFLPEVAIERFEKISGLAAFESKDIRYRKEGGREDIELHWKLGELDTISQSKEFELSQVTERIEFQGESLPVLEKHLDYLYLCFHGIKHDWSRLRWLVDIAEYARTMSLNTNELLAMATHYGLSNALPESAFLCRELFAVHCPSPSDRRAWLAEERAARRLGLLNDPKRFKVQYFSIIYWRSFLYLDYQKRLSFFGWKCLSSIKGKLQTLLFRVRKQLSWKTCCQESPTGKIHNSA